MPVSGRVTELIKCLGYAEPRNHAIVMSSPTLDDDLRLPGSEKISLQQFVSEPGVETLDVPVLRYCDAVTTDAQTSPNWSTNIGGARSDTMSLFVARNVSEWLGRIGDGSIELGSPW